MPATAPRPLLDVFPYEILEKIVFSIPTYEPRDLRNCALASKAFIFPAQRSIFFNICLWKATYAPALIYLFKRSPHLGTYVRELELAAHPTTTRDAERVAILFKLMPSVRRLTINRLHGEAPWDIMRGALEEVILPQLRCMNIRYIYNAPVWLMSSCRQLDELHVNDCPGVIDETRMGGIRPADPLPLRYLRIAHVSQGFFDLLCRSVTQLVALDLPLRDYMYGGTDRANMSLPRVSELMNPMVNTLVFLNVDAWPILHLNDRKISDHPFFIGRYPHLRYFSIRLSVSTDFDEDEDVDPEDLETQLTWLSTMLHEIPSSHPHHLTYLGVSLDNWWSPDHKKESIQVAWSQLDSVLGGNQSMIVFPHMKVVQFPPSTTAERTTGNIEKLLPMVHRRGLLVLNTKRPSWELVR
ncbi:hypothetical protein DL96DRAFT_1817473 [Flagelloscypha sp. PMI_526]|nr:hypothetical protein DL96DRAFT_1817473 [Flagelloscypha sp. PMI_526]